MRITNKQLEEVIKEEIGSDTVPVFKQIVGKRNVSEFKLAEKLGMTINQVRSKLYRLHEKRLVSSIRKKDKKKGWYIYYWTFNKEQAKSLMLYTKRKRLDDLRNRLKREQEGSHFICGHCGLRMGYEEALELGFMCSECGELLEEEDNAKRVSKIKEDIEDLENELIVGK